LCEAGIDADRARRLPEDVARMTTEVEPKLRFPSLLLARSGLDGLLVDAHADTLIAWMAQKGVCEK
jgi:hypothetical protein